MEIRLLGALEVLSDDGAVGLPRRQQRALVAALALRAGQVVSIDRLVEDLWGHTPPASALGSLHNAVSGVRRALGKDAVVTQPPGYLLAIEPDAVDAHRFERLVREARELGAAERAERLRSALALWRGAALDDLAFEPFALAEAARLEELRLAALEERIDADLELGRHAELVAELERLAGAHAERERLSGQLMLALYRSGRQAEALEVYRTMRLAMQDLGLDPSAALRELELAILRQDPTIAAPSAPAGASVPAARPERRLVTVLAATPPAHDDPEGLRRQLDETLEAVRGALARHHGKLERFGPEGFVALFGAEAPGDDDAVRAVRAAAELGLDAGVATGEVVDGAGAVVSRAVELARRGGITLDERTRALVHAARRLDAPLVGRTSELARLRAELEAASAERRCRVVTLLGDPGIGKTRLARELLVGSPVAEPLVARCLSSGEGATFLPLLAALRRANPEEALAGEPDAELVVARLAALAGDGEAGSVGESYWAVRRLLEALARRRSVVLVLDDVHWAEPALLDLVEYLEERAAIPLLVVCLARPELARPLGEPLRLGPLAPDEARVVIEQVAQVDDVTRDRIVELAEGNALYAEQLATYAAETEGEGLPPTLEAVLAGRLGQLDDDERSVLQRASVIGREFSRSTVAALAERPVDAELASLSRRGLIGATADADPGDDGYRFHHVLLRDAAYATVTKAERADLHERVARGLAEDALAGYHLEQAVELRRELGLDADELAAEAGERLGDAAMRTWRQNDAAAAVGLLRRATDLMPPGERRAELLCELAVALGVRGAPADIDAALGRAEAEAAGSVRLSSRVRFERAARGLAAGTSTPSELLEAAQDALEPLLAAGDDRALGRAWLGIKDAHLYGCRYEAQLDAARKATVHYRQAGFSPAACFVAIAQALLHGPTRVDDAARECAALLDGGADRMSEANVLVVLSALAAMDGRINDARTLSEEAHELYEEVDARRAASGIWAWHRLFVERRAGDLAKAVSLAAAGAETFGGLGERAYQSSWLAELAELLYWQGRYDEAARAVAEARALAPDYDLYAQFTWRAVAAKLAARAGRRREAERLARQAVRLASSSDAPVLQAETLVALAEVERVAGNTAEAAQAADRAEVLLLAKGDRTGIEKVRHVLQPAGVA